MPDPKEIAQENLETRIRSNPYPGRGILIGLSEDGTRLVQAYWIMGRSPNSRNRVFRAEGGDVWTEAADPAKVEDPSLIIYNAMRELDGVYIVSNGDQTDTIHDSLRHGATFEQALATRAHEPDAPNYTPRISGLIDARSGVALAKMSVIKASAFGPEHSARSYFEIDDFSPGLGCCVTTYVGDGAPLPPFEGEPFLLPLAAGEDAIADALWRALDADNKVSLAVKTLDLGEIEESRIIVRNKYEKV